MTDIHLGIGALSKATGIPINTLRTWERRYGVPSPGRTEGGQRVYDAAEVQRLRLIARSLESGHRPGQIMKATLADLQELVGEAVAPPPVDLGVEGDLAPIVDAVRRLDGDALEGIFRTELARMGMVHFLQDRVGPLLTAIGCAWESGTILPYQEHFASEHLRDFLAGQWRRMSDVAGGPVGICAALPGERHHLGLHLVACVLASRDWRIVFLGGDTPVSDVESCVFQVQASALFVSISSVAPRQDTRWMLTALRGRLPSSVSMVIGGMGAPQELAGIHNFKGLDELDDWAKSH